MEIPKYIEKALRRREHVAIIYEDMDHAISQFIRHRGLEDDIDSCDYAGGTEALLNPAESSERIRQAILNK